MQSYYNLGEYSWPITTSSEVAQLWFDRGLIWSYAYNHQESIRCFERAIAYDPNCAMAQWGIAYASGPNYNIEWKHMDAKMQSEALTRACTATDRALELVDSVTAPEAALIRALPARYPQREPLEDMRPWNDDFAEAMRQVYNEFADHPDVACIFAESMMNRTPWKMWDLFTGEPGKRADTEECRRVLEKALEQHADLKHPGLLHLYVHLMEMSPVPEVALKIAQQLRDVAPDAGHLIHMGTHIDMLCGSYSDVVFWNLKACEADEIWYQREGPLNMYTAYRQHNWHFVMAGAMFLGQFKPAIAAVRGLAKRSPEEFLRIESPPMADFYEAIQGLEPHILVRFGKWQEAIEMPLPEDQELYCCLTANIHYARAVAHAALGNVAEAEAEEKLFLAAVERVPETRRLHNNLMENIFAVGVHMVRGEIAYRKGEYDDAFASLRQAIELEDGLNYDEPWGWMQPVRHALGALLLEQGRAEEAETVFREDLGLAGDLPRAVIHPDNIWALKGLSECLEKRGDEIELPHIRNRLVLAAARADMAPDAACFCAGGSPAVSPM